MEKILLPLDGQHQNTYAVDFACFLARLTRSKLTAVFLEGTADGTGTRKPLREPITLDEYVTADADENRLDTAIRQFRESCVCRDVPSRIHRDRGIPVQELTNESRFADLIVLDPETIFANIDHQQPAISIEKFIHACECPIVIAPFNFKALDTIYFAFDGSESSVYAIKQFTYLFPELHTRKIVVITVVPENEKAAPGIYLVKEWLQAHYQDVDYTTLNGNPADALFGFLLEKENSVIVLGAYGRGNISRALNPSHARLLMKAVNLPLFIAHR